MRNIIENRFVSAEEAAQKLRNRITRPYVHLARRLIGASWVVAKMIAVAFVLLLIEGLIFMVIFRSPQLFAASFVLGDVVIFVLTAYLLHGFWSRKHGKHDVLIGRSFAHETEMSRAGYAKKSVSVGRDNRHYIDYLHEPNHHVLINGSTSSGKTTTLLTFTARASLANGINFLMIDWNGENVEWAKRIGAAVWSVPANFKVNPFKLDGLSKEARASLAVESLIVAARLTALQSTKVKSSLLKFYASGTEPSLYDLWNALCSNDRGKANVLNQRLRAIQRVIGYEPREFWESVFARNNLVDLSGLNESEKSLVVYSIMQRISEIFDRKQELHSKLRLLVVLDEAWQFFRRERDYDLHRESSLEKVVRLGRKYGFGLAVSTQQIEDAPKAFINSSSLIMLHQQREHTYMGRDIMELGDFESAYLKSAAQGELLLFDRGMAQKGQWWPDYIRVEPLSGKETSELSGKYAAYMPGLIHEPEMPIEMHDSTQYNGGSVDKNGLLEGLDIPSVAVYRFLIALNRTGNLQGAYKLLREKGWITSKATLYGGLGKPSLLVRAQSGGYATGDGKLTERSMQIIDSERLIARQGTLSGSEEHKQLMRKTIEMIQDRGNYAFTLSDKDSFDIGEIRAKTKSAWDTEHIAAYECQTNAIKEEIEKCVSRADVLGLTFVVPNKELSVRISEICGGRYETMIIG